MSIIPDLLPEENVREKICINGEWNFKIDGGNDWVNVRVPGSYTGVRSEKNWGKQYWDIWDYPENWEGKGGTYKRTFTLPAAMKGKHISFCCEGLRHHSIVMINNEQVGQFNEAYVPFEYDITDQLKEGANEIKVIVKPDKNDLFEDYKTTLRGIYQNTYLKSYSDLKITEDAFLRTSVKKSEIKYDLPVKNTSSSDQKFYIRNYITDMEGNQVKIIDGGWHCLKTGKEENFTCEGSWQDPHLWFPHAPYLYHIYTVLFNENGDILDKKMLRFGFREITWEGPHLYLNGRELYLRGHAGHSLGDIQGNREYYKTWLSELKKHGINFMRLHNNPKHEALYEVADELGILLEAEAAFHFKLPEEEERAKLHMSRLVKHQRNHSSVIIWSVSNELHWQGYPEPKFLIDLCRELDPSRPVFASDFTPHSIYGDLTGHHYSPKTVFEDWEQYAPDKPMIWDEFSSVWQHDRPLKNGTAGYEVSSQDYATGLWRDGHDQILADIEFMHDGKEFNGEYHRVNGFIPWDLSYNFFRWQPTNKHQTMSLNWNNLSNEDIKPKYIKSCASTVNIWDLTLPVFEPNPGFYLFNKYLKPVRFFDEEQSRTFFSGETATRTSKLFYEDLRLVDEISCRVETEAGKLLSEKKFPLEIKPGTVKEKVELSWDLPDVDTVIPVKMVRQFNYQGKAGYRDTFNAKIFPSLNIQEVIPQGQKVAVYDPDDVFIQKLKDINNEISGSCFDKIVNLDESDIREINHPETSVDYDIIILTATLSQQDVLTNFVKQGGKVLNLVVPENNTDNWIDHVREGFTSSSRDINLSSDEFISKPEDDIWRGYSTNGKGPVICPETEASFTEVVQIKGNLVFPGEIDKGSYAYLALNDNVDKNNYLAYMEHGYLDLSYILYGSQWRNLWEEKGADAFRKSIRVMVQNQQGQWFLSTAGTNINLIKPNKNHRSLMQKRVYINDLEWQQVRNNMEISTAEDPLQVEEEIVKPDFSRITAVGLYLDESAHTELDLIFSEITFQGTARPDARVPVNGPEHRLLQGLEQQDFTYWRHGSTAAVLPVAPGENVRTVLLGNKDGIGAALQEKFQGKGIEVATTLKLVQDLGQEPAAGWLLRNLLHYLIDYQPETVPAATVVMGSDSFQEYFRNLNLIATYIDPEDIEDINGVLSKSPENINHNSIQSLIIEGENEEVADRLLQERNKIQSFVENGGKIFLSELTETTVAKYGEIIDEDIQLTEPFLAETEHCIKGAVSWTRADTPQRLVEYYDGILIPQPFEVNYDPVLAGIANYDLYWDGQKMFTHGIEIKDMDPVTVTGDYNILINNWCIDWSQPADDLYGEYVHGVKDMRRADWFINRDPVLFKINQDQGYYLCCQLHLRAGGHKGQRIMSQILTAMKCSLGEPTNFAPEAEIFDLNINKQQLERFEENDAASSVSRKYYGIPDSLPDYWQGSMVDQDKVAGNELTGKLPSMLLLGNELPEQCLPLLKERFAGKYEVDARANLGNTQEALIEIEKIAGSRTWDIIHLSLGLEDIKNINGQPAVDIEQYVNNLKQIMEILKKHKTGNKYYFSTIIPVSESSDNYLGELIPEYNRQVKAVLSEYDVYVNDLFSFINKMQPAYLKQKKQNEITFSTEELKALTDRIGDALEFFGAQ